MADYRETQAAIQRAETGINAAKAWPTICPVPHELAEARARLAELGRLASLPAPLPVIPTGKPEAIEKALRAHARETVEVEALRTAALASALAVGGQVVHGLREAATTWIGALVAEFAETHRAFVEADSRAPRSLGGQAQHDEIAAWVEATGLADALDQLAATRANIRAAAGEASADFNNVWLCVVPPILSNDPVQFNGVGGVGGQWHNLSLMLREYEATRRTSSASLERWRAVSALGLEVALAGPGEIAARAEVIGWQQSAAHALNGGPGGGQFAEAMRHADATYRQVGDLCLTQPRPRRSKHSSTANRPRHRWRSPTRPCDARHARTRARAPAHEERSPWTAARRSSRGSCASTPSATAAGSPRCLAWREVE